MLPDRPDHPERCNRARLSLEGLAVGDAFGERFFIARDVAERCIRERALPAPPWTYTDDTVMALSIVEQLEAQGQIDPDHLARAFAAKYAADPHRGYGGMAHILLQAMHQGGDWRQLAPAAFEGTGSMGNGGAMRAAPIGGYFADDFEEAARQARRSAEITHAHPEGQAGAIAVAVAAAWACSGADDTNELFEAVTDHTPESDTRTGIIEASKLSREGDVQTAASVLGNGSRVTAPDTVPFTLWCAARHSHDYEAALWATVSGLGDRDTTCAIVGGIVSLAAGHTSIPAEWLAAREALSTLAGIRSDDA